MRALKIVAKTLAWIIGIVLLLLLIVVVAVQVPSVQNKLLAWATPTIEDMLGGAEVRIDHINLKFFDSASFEGIYIGDLSGDTLVYARSLSADIGVFDLFGGEVFLDRIALDGAVVNAYQRRQDSAFNYQFILDAFAPTDTVATDTSAAAFTVGIRTVDVTDTRIRLLDEWAGSDLNVTVARLLTEIGTLDQETLAVALDRVLVEGVRGSFVIDQVDPIERAVVGTAQDTLPSGATVVTFPVAGFPLSAKTISLRDIELAYRDANVTGPGEGLNAGDLAITAFNAEAKDLSWDSTRLAVELESLSLREQSGIAVDQLAFRLAMTDQALTVDGLEFSTPRSQVLAEAALTYPSFAQLVAVAPDTRVEATFRDSYLAFDDLKLLAPTLAEAGLNLDAGGAIYLDGAVRGTLAALTLEDVNVRTGQQTAVALSGTLTNPLDPERVRYDLRVSRLTSSYADLDRLTQGLELPAELRRFGRFNFSGNVSGGLTDFRGRDLRLTTDGRTGFVGDISARNIDDPNRLYLDANVRSLRTRMSELEGFLPDSLAVDAMALGDVDFKGTFRGTLTDFALDGRLDSDLGSSTTDLVASFNSDYTDGTYKGTIALEDFDVGRLMRDTTIGTITVALDVDGSGLALENISTDLNTTIPAFTYNGYTYTNIRLDGRLDQQVFVGDVAIDDPNARINFDGTINLRDSVPDLEFVARIDTLALQPLNFYPTPLGVSMSIVSNLRGNTADNLVGRLRIDSFTLQDSVATARIETMALRAGDTSSGRFLVFESPIFRAGLIGDYRTADLPMLFTNYVNDFFPIDEFMSPVDRPADLAMEPTTERVIADQSFEFYAHASEPTYFINFFDPNLERLDTMSLVGSLDTRERALDATLLIPDLMYDGTRLDTILVTVGGDLREMLVDLRTVGIDVAGQHLELATAGLRLADDSLRFNVSSYLDADSLLLRTGLSVSMNERDRYVIHMDSLLEVAGQRWAIEDGNEIEYWNNYLRVRGLTFEKDDQRISIASSDASDDADFAPITVTIDNYQLAEITRLVQLTGFTLDGEVNGTLGVQDPGGNLYYVADLSVDSLNLNGGNVGDLSIDANTEDLAGAVAIDVKLKSEVNDFSLTGSYGISDGALDLTAAMPALELRLIDPVMQGLLSESEGLVVADMRVTGTVDRPVVNGFLGFDDAATTYDLLGTRVVIPDSRITFTERRMDFGQFVIYDGTDRSATLTGGIDHDYFGDFDFGLRLRTDAFKILGTGPAVDALYYGDAITRADVRIGGDLALPVVNVIAATVDSTDVYIQPLISTNGISEESWVIYANPWELARDSTQQLADVYNANVLGIDLTMTLQVTEEAVVNVIVDPATGDALRARGDADIAVQMSPDGDINVTGVYTLSDGSYQFSFAPGGFAVQQRDFEIREGSTLQFVGDPLDTRFDIAAVYSTETTTYELIADELPDAGPGAPASPEVIAAQRRQPVNVIMAMRGNLEEPLLTFDIEVPESSTAATSAVQQKLAQLRQTPNELYQQVFGLLVLNSFMSSNPTAGGSGGGIAGAGTNLAINSVSRLVTNQLNNLADNYLKGVNLNVGLESYEDQYATSGRTTVANVDLSKSFFNERLTISIGTETNVGSNQRVGQTASTGGFQSSFVLTYQLTESGHYLLRAFRRPDYDVLSAAGQFETGAGVTYRRRFE